MNCPNCQTQLPDPPPRFCDTCGMSTGVVRKPAAPKNAPAEIRCQECGVVATAARCRGCGAKVKWPDGVEPPE